MTTLTERLGEFAAKYEAYRTNDFTARGYTRMRHYDPALLSIAQELHAMLVECGAASKELSNMYTHAWDRVDGAVFMAGESVPRFERAHHGVELMLAKLKQAGII